MNNKKIFSRRVVMLSVAYLAIFLISIYFYYETDAMFKRGLFYILYTAWGLWFYANYLLLIIVVGLVAVKLYRHGIPQKIDSFSAIMVLVFGVHMIYGVLIIGFKYYVYYDKTTNRNVIEEQLQMVKISTPIITYDSALKGQNSSYIINMTVTNPLPYNVKIRLGTYSKGKPYSLLKENVRAEKIDTFSVHINADIVTGLLERSHGFWINYSLTENVSSPRIIRLINLSHELCKWAIMTCPDLDEIQHSNNTYPFNDDMLFPGVASFTRRGILTEYSQAEIDSLRK